ncbi:MAG: hypothetical protein V4603_18215, partial [Pseudomonadota bacterium]
VIFGHSLAEAEQAAGPRNNSEVSLEQGCTYVTFATLPDLMFMVEQGVVVRADSKAAIANVLGVQVGATLESVTAAHPEARLTPHKYDPTGQYLIFPSADGASAIVMEAAAGKIAAIRAGLEPAVEYVEGCS